jgi:hypothetical protein
MLCRADTDFTVHQIYSVYFSSKFSGLKHRAWATAVETLHRTPPAFQPNASDGTDHDTGHQLHLLRYVLTGQASTVRVDSTRNPTPVDTDCKPTGTRGETLQQRSKQML